MQEKTGVPIIACAQVVDIYRVKKHLGMGVWAQHVDPIEPGRNSGWILPKSVKEAGATGSVVNHAEHPVSFKTIEATIAICHKYGLKTLVICETPALCKKVALLKPTYIAYEKGALIAGPKSMVDVESQNIKKLAKTIPIPLIVGAGITSGDHVKKALSFGAKGVILASAVILAKNPKAKLMELTSAFSGQF